MENLVGAQVYHGNKLQSFLCQKALLPKAYHYAGIISPGEGKAADREATESRMTVKEAIWNQEQQEGPFPLLTDN